MSHQSDYTLPACDPSDFVNGPSLPELVQNNPQTGTRSIHPASNSTKETLNAFHVKVDRNLDVKFTIPQGHLPVTECPPQFFQLGGDDVFGFHRSHPLFRTDAAPFYRTLREVARHTYDASLGASSGSVPSDSEEEETKPELASQELLCILVEDVMLYCCDPTLPGANDSEYEIKLVKGSRKDKVIVAQGAQFSAVTDGQLRVFRNRRPKRSRVVKNLIVAQMEAKRRNGEDMIDEVHGQLFAESLTMALVNARLAGGPQETVIFAIHLAKAFFVHTHFPDTYLRRCAQNAPLPADAYVVMKRSVSFDLMETSARRTYFKNVAAWVNYATSLQHEIGAVPFYRQLLQGRHDEESNE
ncbi:hypothetical protein HKX48_003231 [Thoreauomyces humboldtii]|nr:hypothetical protein HKX48_003231 [Thoreauomyces humboldtii]